jgi:hypothetical protein
MRKVFTVFSLLAIAGTAGIARADSPVPSSPQPKPAAAITQTARPALPVAASARAISPEQKAQIEGQMVCIGIRIYGVCVGVSW